jgi:polysaccharide biosynthesis transport protein
MKEIPSPGIQKSSTPRSGYYGMPSSDAGNFDWREYYFAIKERLWLVIFCVMLFTFCGLYKASSQIFKYRANSVLFIEQAKSRVLDSKVESVTDDQIKSIDMINTMVDLIDSYPFALRVANRIQLDKDNNFLLMTGFFARDPSPSQIAGTLVGMVSASYRPSTDLIDISVISRSSEVSVKLANAYAEEYLYYVEDQKREATRQASAFLMDEAERLRKKMRAAEEGMQNFREREKATSIETMIQEAQTQISECSVRQHALNAQLAQVNSDLDAARADKNDPQALLTLPSVSVQPNIGALVSQTADLEKQFSIVKLRYRAKHPVYITLKTQLDLSNADLEKLLGNVVPLLETMRDSLTAQEAAIKIERENAEKRLLEVTSKSIEYNDLKRELESDSALYESIVSRIKEVDVTKGLSDSSIRIQELAQGAMAVGKSPYSIVFKNFMLGLALGLGLVIGLHKLDTSFKTVDQIEQFTQLNVLTAIPQIGGASASVLGFLSREQAAELFVVLKECMTTLFRTSFPFRARLLRCLDILQPAINWLGNPHRGIALPLESELIVRDDRNGIVAESFRSLRATIAMSPMVENQKTFLFASAVPSEGKSFCSSNFAITLAQQGMKTLLIDADLRKPMISRIFFGMARTPGLVELLQGTATMDSAVNSTSIEGLSILTAGGKASNPSEILAGQGFRDIITEALKRYDRVVIDSAPVLAVSDTLLIAFQAEIVCLVVRAFVTPRRLIKRAIKSLDEIQMRPTGIVLNCLPYSKGSYYYYTSGKYAGHYGKNSYSSEN